MGFFFEPEPEPVKTRQAKQALPLHPAAVGCDNCPLKAEWPRLITPRMPMFYQGRDPDVLVLGEAPGKVACKKGRPFVDDDGQFLRRTIPGHQMDRLAFQSTVRCRTPADRTPTAAEAWACSPYLADNVRALRPRAILGVGQTPLRSFIADKDGTILRIHGVWFPVEIGGITTWYFPIVHPAYVIRGGEERSAAYAIFRNDIRTFFRQVDQLPEPRIVQLLPEMVRQVHSETEAMALLDRMREPIGFDIETNGLKPYATGAKILTAAFSDGETTFAIPVKHREAPNEWGWRVIDRVVSTMRWVGHASQFELLWAWFFKGGPANWNPPPFDDSMAEGRLFHERSYLLSLDILSRIHLGTAVKQVVPIDRKRVEDYPLSEVLPYNGLDALSCLLIHRKLHKKVDAWQLNKILATEKSVTAMELLGLPADQGVAKTLFDRFDAIRQGAIATAAGLYEVRQYEAEQGPFSIASPEKVGFALVNYGKVDLPKTEKSIEHPEGKQRYSTDDTVLEALAGTNPLINAVREYRDVDKILGTYIEPIMNGRLVMPDGCIHPTYKVMFTHTLRLSSEDPNVQNYPKHGHHEVRGMIVAPKGYILVAIDMGQIQGRLAAMASRDRRLMDAFIKGFDIHSEWRDRLIVLYPNYLDHVFMVTHETDEKKLFKAARNVIKSDFVFATIFGAAASSCADRTGVPLVKMQRLQMDFFREHPGVLAYHKKMHGEYPGNRRDHHVERASPLRPDDGKRANQQRDTKC